MKAIKFTVLFFFCFLSLHAQLKFNPNGKVIIGPPNDNPAEVDVNEVASAMIFGKNGPARAGSKLTFGDFGRQVYSGGSWNAFIGEYGDTDTDKLWLHGKKGCYLTYISGYDDQIVAFYDVAWGNRFNFNCDIYANGIQITSDLRFKENIQKLENPLSTLCKLGWRFL